MTLGNMRANGVRSLAVYCWQCHHQVVINADQWPDDVPVPSFGERRGQEPVIAGPSWASAGMVAGANAQAGLGPLETDPA
jgi:hypothetical protein